MSATTTAPRRASRAGFALVLGALAAATAACATARPETALHAVDETGAQVSVDSVTAMYEAGGVRVIHRRAYGHDVVSARLYLLGGVRQLTPATAGVEAMLLGASEHGTERYPRAVLRRALGRTGSRIDLEPGTDWTVFGFRGVRQEFDSTWSIFADRLMHPRLDSASVTLVRSQLVAAARRRRLSPDAHVFYLADSAAYVGHPYALSPMGTEASLTAITPDLLRRYLAEQLVTSRMLLVVVGDIPRAQVEGAVQRTLGTLPRGSYAWSLPAARPVRGPAFTATVEGRGLAATNYLLGLFDGPPASSPDYAAFQMATALLSSRLAQEIRYERALSYAASADFLDRARPAGGVYVSTVSPGAVLPLIRAEVRNLQNLTLPPLAMSYFSRQWVTGYFYEHETSAAQADYLARAQLLRGDWRAGSRYMEDLRHVSVGDIRRVARAYMKDIRFAYVGDTTAVARGELTKF